MTSALAPTGTAEVHCADASRSSARFLVFFMNATPAAFSFVVTDEEEQFHRMSLLPILISGIVIKSAGLTGRLLGIYMFPRS